MNLLNILRILKDYFLKLCQKIILFFEENKLELALMGLFLAFPNRILSFSILQLSPEQKLLGITLLFIIFFLFKKTLISYLFNHRVFQFYLFCCFKVENYLRRNIVLFLLVCFFGSFWTCEGGVDRLLTNTFLFIFLTSYYLNFKRLILNPDSCSYFQPIEKAEELSWEKIFITFSSLSTDKFSKTPENKLPEGWKATSFPYVARRYMFSRVGRQAVHLISAGASGGPGSGILEPSSAFLTSLGLFIAGAGCAASVYNTSETNKVARETIADMRRANDLKEKEIKNMESQSLENIDKVVNESFGRMLEQHKADLDKEVEAALEKYAKEIVLARSPSSPGEKRSETIEKLKIFSDNVEKPVKAPSLTSSENFFDFLQPFLKVFQ